MGLDQYLNKVERTEVQYWRKNNQLQGWFERNCDQQNCVPTKLNQYNIEIVDMLLTDLAERNMPITEGFFYGGGQMEEEEYEDLIKLFTKVKEDIEQNDAEYEYDCWY